MKDTKGTLLRFIMAVAMAAKISPRAIARNMIRNRTRPYAKKLYEELERQQKEDKS